MTVEATVASFVRSVKPRALCDHCIAKNLRLGSDGNRVMARNATSGLGQTKDFTRAKGICYQCGGSKLVIQAN